MAIDSTNSKVKSELDKVQALFYLHSIMFIFAKFFEYIKYEFSLISFVGLLLWLVFYRFFNRTLKNLLYSYWTMFVIIIFTLITDIYTVVVNYHDVSLLYLYIASLFSILFCSYFLHSPIFYPVVNWWEYDFRFRNDVDVKVINGDKELEGRLVDLRRSSGGLYLFENIEVGHTINIKTENKKYQNNIHGEIISKRRHTIGRPFIYGVKFIFDNDFERKTFKSFQKFWNFERKTKQKQKFES